MAEVHKLAAIDAAGKGELCIMPTTAAIFDLIDACREHRQIGLVLGNPGIGKSWALAEKARRDRSLVVTRIPRVAHTLQPCLIRIAAALDAYVPANSAAMDVHNAIIDAVPPRDDAFALIIDEAQNMDAEALVGMQDLHDEARIPIVLVANPVLQERLTSKRSARLYNSFGPLRARIGPSLFFERPSAGDVAALCNHFGIAAARDRKLVGQVANMEGGLHKVERLITMARGAAGAGKAIRSDDLRDAAIAMGVPL